MLAVDLARSTSARRQFQRANPCPATGAARGPCPGYEADHIIPLKCGGPDAPANMQWLTIEQHKAKTRREARACRSDPKISGLPVNPPLTL